MSAISAIYTQVFYFSLSLLCATKEGVVIECITCPYNDNDDDNKMFIVENLDWICNILAPPRESLVCGTIQSALDAGLPARLLAYNN